MSDDVKSAWKDAGERFAALGASLKSHYEQRGTGGEARADQDLGEAARRFAGAIQGAVDSLGAAARDPEVQDDARRVGASLTEALSATFAQVSRELHTMAGGMSSGTTGATDTTGGPGAGDTPPSTSPPEPEPLRPGGEDEPPKVEPWGTP
jgi:hypothetical protein